MGFLLSGSFFLVLLDDVNDFLVQPGYFIFKFIIGLSKLGDVRLHFIFLLLGHQSFSHAVSDGWFIEGLVSLNCHFYLVTDSNQEESSLGTVNCDLSNELIKALGVKFLSDWADSCLSSLSRLKFLIKVVLKVDHIHSGCWGWRNITHP